MKLLIVTQAVDLDHSNLSFFHRWIEVFAESVESITIICLQKGRIALPKNATVFSLGKEQQANRLTRLFRFYWYSWRERKNYDSVFVHMNPEYVILGGLLWRMLGKKVILWYTHKAVNLRLKIAHALAHAICTASKESFRLGSHKVTVVGHGIDTHMFTPRLSEGIFGGTLRLLTVGRVAPVKDLKTIIRVATGLHERGYQIRLDIVGASAVASDHEYQKEVRELITRCHADDYIQFVGAVPNQDLPQVYQNNDIFLHASQTGSVDKAVLEALASGLIVFTSSGAYEGFSGPILHFREGDHADVVEKIIRLVQEGLPAQSALPELRKQIDVESVVKKILSVFGTIRV